MAAVRSIREGDGFTLVHTADLHLGSGMRVAQRLGREDDLKDATYEALANLIDVVRREDAAFLTLGGDLFDVPNLLNPGPRRRLAGALAEVPDTQVAIVRGNHDHHHRDAPRIAWPENVFEFEGSRTTLDCGWVRIHGVSYAQQHERENLVPRYPAADPSRFDIGLLHANVGSVSGHAPYAPCTVGDLVAKGYRMWLLGHIHKAAVLSEDPFICYPGNLQGRDINESGPRTTSVLEVSGAGRVMHRVERVHSILWERLDVDMTGIEDPDEALRRIETTLDEARRGLHGARGLIVRIRLTGETRAHAALSKITPGGSTAMELATDLNDRYGSRDPFVLVDRVEVHTRVPLDLERLAASDDIAGLLVRMAGDATTRAAILTELAAMAPPEVDGLEELAAGLWQEALQGALVRLRGGDDVAH